MNILILGTGIIEQKLINLCLKSKLLDRIYTASNKHPKDIPNIEFNNFEELAQKAKAIQIDLVLVADKNLIEQGIVEFLKKHKINIVSVNQKWFNLESSRLIAKQLMKHYSINHPDTIKAPLAFPIVIKTNKPEITKITHSMQELIDVRKSISTQDFFLEEFLEGDIFYLLSLWDGKNLLCFPLSNKLTEVQEDRLSLYQTKLNFMLSDERADFIGFFTTKLLWSKNDWFVLDYIMHLNEKPDLNLIKSDFLYILNAVIYQKLNEIDF